MLKYGNFFSETKFIKDVAAAQPRVKHDSAAPEGEGGIFRQSGGGKKSIWPAPPSQVMSL